MLAILIMLSYCVITLFLLFLQGARDILTLFGYTVQIEEGVAFPEDSEPDLTQAAKLVAELQLAQREIDLYVGGEHPCPHRIEESIQPQARYALCL